MLDASNLRYRAGGRTVLGPVSAELCAGEVTAILGPNGAGKSTLLNLLSGQLVPAEGELRLNGQLLAGLRPALLARARSVLPQHTDIAFDYTVRDVVELGRFPHRHSPSANETAIVAQAMQATDVVHLADRVLNSLSGGEQARAHLARALAQIWEPAEISGARWLLLDEPTAALDLAHQHQAMALAAAWARQQGIGVIAVLHDLNLALRYADRALMLDGGRVVALGPVREVLQPPRVAATYAVACEWVRGGDGVSQLLVRPAQTQAPSF